MTRDLALVIALAALAVPGCGGEIGTSCDTTSDCTAGRVCVDGRCRSRTAEGDAGIDPRAIVEARIDPEDATLTSIDGAMPTQSLRLIVTRADGTEEDLTARAFWSAAPMHLGAIDAAGTFTASGAAGGIVAVSARVSEGAGAYSASARITVTVERTVLGPGLDPGVLTAFDGAMTDPAAAPHVLYPLEGAVMPQNVAPPDVQWAPIGAAGDLFRVRIAKPHAIVTAVVRADDGFRHAWPVDRTAWRAIAESDPDDAITIELARVESATGRAIAGDGPRTMRLARGSIYGRVYFWDLSAGRTESIDPVSAGRNVVVPAPPPSTTTGGRCVACHTVSQDGRWLWGIREGDNAAMSFDLTAPLDADPAPTRFAPVGSPITVGTFDPSGTRLIGVAGWAGPLLVVDATSGAALPSTGLPSSGASFPAWSPGAGDRIAFMGNVATHPSDGHPIDGDLFVAPVGADLAFGAAAMIHDGSSLAGAVEGGTTDSHPTWAPDASSIVFQHGARTFSFVPGTSDVPAGALYRIAPDGSGLVRLDRANGGADAASAYWPTFAPYVTSEADAHHYHWVAFYSRRDYGNALAGTAGRGLRQLWVAAIDADAPAASDPSFVPYWLPGQSTDVHNIAAYWAPEPCRATGAACGSAGDCCSATCEPGPDAVPVCVPPPATECREVGETCGGDEDCCGGGICTGNVCYAPLG